MFYTRSRPGKGSGAWGRPESATRWSRGCWHHIAPCTLQPETWGAGPIEWYAQKRAVWAWVTWPNRAATREAAWATGGNDRVVMLEVPCEGGHWAPVVWRNAVSVRQVDAA